MQKALEMQNIRVAWCGSLPPNSNVITDNYLFGNIAGYPRMVRTDDDAGIEIDIYRLREDFDLVTATTTEINRIADIKRKANQIILAEYSEIEQRNMTARGLELLNKRVMLGEISDDEINELDEIQVGWNWIKSIRETSNIAEDDNTLLQSVIWPVNI